jgi:hypothetical protein
MKALLIALIAVAALAAPAAAASGPTLPTSDPFYTYTGSSPLSSIAPGTVLKHRSITLVDAGTSVPLTTTQVLYRTTGELGQPTVTVATVLEPATGIVSAKIISYQMAYDALGAQCDPSYTMQGGMPAGGTTNTDEEQFVAGLAASGDIVVVPDYEGTQLDWAAGQEEGYNTLDGIRAAESLLTLPSTTPTAMVGYSGGSIATEFASEMASKYAPKLNLVGVAEGGIPVDFAHNLAYINGSPSWSGVIPAVLVSLSRAFGDNLDPYLSPYGRKLANQVSDECINNFVGEWPGLTIQKLLKPSWQNVYDVPGYASITDKLIMGRMGTPKGPLFMGVGDADGTGDGVMVYKDVQALAHEYCQRGVSVQLNIYNGDDHTQAAVAFLPSAAVFLDERLAGAPVSNGCSSIPAGNALTPVPLPPKLKLRYAGPSKKLGGVVVYLRAASAGTLPNVSVTLKRGRKLIEALNEASITTKSLKLVLRHNGHALGKGRYTLTVTQPTVTLARKAFRVRAGKRRAELR